MSILPGRQRVKRSARTANINSEPEGLLHDDTIDIVRYQTKIYKRSNKNPTTESCDLVALKDYFDTKFSKLELDGQHRVRRNV